MNTDIIDTVILNIFRKAQVEKDIIFYGKLCEILIKMELDLRGIEPKINSMKESLLRKTLLKCCKEFFEKFFS